MDVYRVAEGTEMKILNVEAGFVVGTADYP